EKGHIITNAHVVRGAASALIQFSDGRETIAELLGQDPSTDVAVLRAQSMDGLIPARRATAVPLRRGERVYAFGSPFGFK
ncbi:trypsin-like peptidase domain-containing protein, partial [Streptococcus suis]|uniref:trypsin-like peptidase domain-containing protein n=1 Tax=Streptococcus suis TaxID=1307 RepID=UPI00378CE4FA